MSVEISQTVQKVVIEQETFNVEILFAGIQGRPGEFKDLRLLLPFSDEQDLGATKELDFSTASNFKGVMNTDLELTLLNVADGQRCQIHFYHDGSTQRAFTNIIGIDFWLGEVPTQGPDANEVLIMTLVNDGESVIGVADIAEAA
jgi:hypothetical protein